MLLNTVLKMPFSKEFLSSGTALAHIVRTLRYGLVIFCVCGLYPMVFKFADKIAARYIALVGGDELARGVVKLRNLATREETEIPCENAAASIAALL